MRPKKLTGSAAEFEKKRKRIKKEDYVLRLYVAGMTPKSKEAILNIKKICDGHLEGRYELDVIDITRNPVLAAGEQIVATPTLIRKLPAPLRRFIGDMTQVERILLGIDLRKKDTGKDTGTQREREEKN